MVNRHCRNENMGRSDGAGDLDAAMTHDGGKQARSD